MSFLQFKKDVEYIGRLNQIVTLLWKYEFDTIASLAGLRKPRDLEQHKGLKEEEKVRKLLEELGGTFIKLGQLLSIRPDLIPAEYCQELAKLQDHVQPFPGLEAKKLIETNLDARIDKYFSNFQEEPLAAASISQVHEAVLKGKRKKVVIKIQRPNIKKLLETDLHLMRYFANIIDKKWHPKLFSPTEIIDEFEQYSHKELDFAFEARNYQRFYLNFSGSKTTYIPHVYADLSTSEMIVMEKVEGVKLSQFAGTKVQKARLARNLAESVFEQIFVHGLFHADPHPGNILVTHDMKLAFLDFGIVGVLTDEVRGTVMDLFISMINKDVDGMVDNLFSLGFVDSSSNVKIFKEDMVSYFGQYYGANIKDIDMSNVFMSMFKVARKNKIKLPASFVLLGKSLVTLHGVAKDLDPHFNLVEVAKPYTHKLLKDRMQPKAVYKSFMHHAVKYRKMIQGLPQQSSMLVDTFSKTKDSVETMEKDLHTIAREVDKTANRVVLAVLLVGFLVAGSLMIHLAPIVLFGISLISLLLFSFSIILFLILLSFLFFDEIH